MELTHHRPLSSAAMQSSSSTSPPLTRPLQRTGYVAAEGLDRYSAESEWTTSAESRIAAGRLAKSTRNLQQTL
jgi:hypothetical protein